MPWCSSQPIPDLMVQSIHQHSTVQSTSRPANQWEGASNKTFHCCFIKDYRMLEEIWLVYLEVWQVWKSMSQSVFSWNIRIGMTDVHTAAWSTTQTRPTVSPANQQHGRLFLRGDELHHSYQLSHLPYKSDGSEKKNIFNYKNFLSPCCINCLNWVHAVDRKYFNCFRIL